MATLESYVSFLEPWDSAKKTPYVRGKVEDEYPQTNFSNTEYKVQFHDARPDKSRFDLDTHGFAFHNDAPISTEIVEAVRSRDKTRVIEMYYPDVESMVKAKTGAKKVVIFDYTYRRRDPALAPSENPNGKEQPATVAHVDQSALGAVLRVKRHAGEDAEALLKGRAQIINVWRPIHGTVEDWALGMVDYRSLKGSDVHPTNIFKERLQIQGQTVSVNYSETQKWYYLDHQTTSEVTFIKIWDSKEGVANLCPHCSFPDPRASTSVPPRESIEVRCLVFY